MKSIMFKTKIFHEGKMYLLVSDVTKLMEISEKAFCKKYSDKIVEIPGCRKCIAETDFNLLISDDKELFKKMGMLEVTKVETLRSEIASIISFQPLKFMMAKEYLNMMKIKTGCKSEQQYVEKYEIPKEFDEALQRFMNSHHDNSYYKSMINYLKNKECFDLDKIRELGLDIQYLSSITSDGSMTLEVFVVGKGIFYSVLEDDEGEQWNEIHIDEMGNIKLPYFSYYSDRVEERIINLSHTEVDRDFSRYNTVENIQWCIQNLNMKGIEDYEFDVLGYHSDAIDLRIHTDLLVKMIVPDAIDTIFTDQIIDLAKIYGYSTKAFNQQVKNNSERFASDFAFKLTKEEVNNLRSKNLTSSWGGSRYLPNAFTEQGIYMLMTILKGDLAVKQSIDLVRTFKKMKDYILENRELIGQRKLLQLSMETTNNRIEISKINSDMISIEKQISDVVEGLKDVVTKSELADMMNSFISDDDEKWLMYNAKFSSADEVYASIYRQAKVSIYVVDNYIGLRTLVHLKNSQSGVSIILFSDNVGNNKLHNIEFTDFCKEYPNVKISMQKTGGIFHDRFIVLDYGISKYAPVIAALLKNPTLILPR